MNPERIIRIITKSVVGDISDNDKSLLDRWLAESEDNRRIYTRLTSPGGVTADYGLFECFESLKDAPAITKRKFRNYVKAVAGGLVAAVAVFIAVVFRPFTADDIAVDSIDAPAAGTDKMAVLILANGDAMNIEQQLIHIESGGSTIESDGERLVYRQSDGNTAVGQSSESNFNITYNTLKVPARSTFGVVLADGTRITLNSYSEIRYPVSFGDGLREVFLNGEAYFDIVRDEERPFVVRCPNQIITVLGTRFNVEAYADGSDSVTALVEGSVQIESGRGKAVIHPGVVAFADGSDIRTIVTDADPYTTWVDDLFAFNDETLESILRKLERWYGVKFTVEGDATLAGRKFTGSVPRYVEIEELFEVLERSANAVFRSEGGDRIRVILGNKDV